MTDDEIQTLAASIYHRIYTDGNFYNLALGSVQRANLISLAKDIASKSDIKTLAL